MGGFVLLASLYLPWLESSASHPSSIDLFSPTPATVDGWSSEVGAAAALSALLLVGAAIAGQLRPRLADRLPLSQCALLAFYFEIAVGAQARSTADQRRLGRTNLHFHYAYGAYVGVAAAIVVLLAAVASWRAPDRPKPMARRDQALRVAALVPAGGLLVALLLPWERYDAPIRLSFRGIASPAGIAAAAVTIWLLVDWWSSPRGARGARVALAATTTLFAGAAIGSAVFPGTHVYGAWIGLGTAVALLALVVADAGLRRPPRPSAYGFAMGVAGGLLIASLFLPWQEYCYPRATDFGRVSGRCISTDGWSTVGTAAAALAIVLILMAVARLHGVLSVGELTAGIALLVATLGFTLIEGGDKTFRFGFAYGSTVGFAAAALLVALAALRLRPTTVDRSRLVRLVPIAACVAYLVLVVLPWWDVLTRDGQSALRFATPSWLTIAGLVVAVRLVRAWSAQVARASASIWLVFLPLGLLALAAVDLFRLRDGGISWGGGLVVALSLLLVLFGWVEQRDGLDSLRVPEILRVDRL